MSDFNEVLKNQITALIESKGESNELKIIDQGYMITLLIEKTYDSEECE